MYILVSVAISENVSSAVFPTPISFMLYSFPVSRNFTSRYPFPSSVVTVLFAPTMFSNSACKSSSVISPPIFSVDTAKYAISTISFSLAIVLLFSALLALSRIPPLLNTILIDTPANISKTIIVTINAIRVIPFCVFDLILSIFLSLLFVCFSYFRSVF